MLLRNKSYYLRKQGGRALQYDAPHAASFYDDEEDDSSSAEEEEAEARLCIEYFHMVI